MLNEDLNIYICRMAVIVWKQDRTRLNLYNPWYNLIGSLIIRIVRLRMYYTRLSFFLHVLHISFYFRGLCNIFNKCHWTLTLLHLCNWEFTEPWHPNTYVIFPIDVLKHFPYKYLIMISLSPAAFSIWPLKKLHGKM